MMIQILSERAKSFLASPLHYKEDKSTAMRKYPGHPNLWVEVEWGETAVKNLSFSGELKDYEKVMMEAVARLLAGKKIEILRTLTARECEAFLRDRNSVLALDGMTETFEKEFKSLFAWLANWPRPVVGRNYLFSSEKGPFRRLSVVEKVKELKAFLLSPEILTLYQNHPRPELIDVDDLTVYIQAPYHSQEERALFEELHILGVATFQEENLNFIPEA